MMMNGTNAVYGGGVCPQQPPIVDYGGDSQIFYGDVGQQHYGYPPASDPQPAEPPNSHLPHQIINEANGLSYTNLDAGHPYSSQRHHHHHHQPYCPQSSGGPFYRTFDYDVMSSNPDPGGSVVPSYPPASYHHLDPMSHQVSISRRSNNTYGAYPSESYDSQHHVGGGECQQINGVSGFQRTQTPQQHPVPTYKWMQVKRSLPKPGKIYYFRLFEETLGKRN
ncbi:homeobox protein Hox-A1-like [Stegodyphus dumicola]|uniref:homeobox protein Hox-A1-like n=1 Tax=Stegodyphus dumicola TaxID=202533 RepID=UPI0015B09074|nr:homeobox protein Hox-A1-like [Stegodyphus dumicola]